MLKTVETKEEANKCDILLNKLIIDEKKYDETIDEKFIVKDFYSNIIQDKRNTLIADIEDNDIVAYIFIKRQNDEMNNSYYLIDSLYVEEEYRRIGIAKKLINEAIKICKDNKASYIDINVMYQNELAKKLYKSFGFNELRLTLRKNML